jgi:pimeloyl-ACP methyl ester carboxylesterase/DNA-binding CsgD family transcriptional regulator
MGQTIGFCTATDGVRIAYATIGDGPPLVYATGWPGHLELEWRKPFARGFLEDLAAGFTLIRYDMRGSGLSDDAAADLSFDALAADLEAVVDHLRLDRFALLSLGDLAGPISIRYAGNSPERVSRLVLNSPFAHGADIASARKQTATVDFVQNYGFPTSEFADAPGVDAETLRDVRHLVEAAASHARQAEVLRILYDADVTHWLGRIVAPTLVLHARGDTFVPFEVGRDVAARIPGAEFVPFEGASNAPWAHRQVILQEVHRFLRPLLGQSPAMALHDADHEPLPDNLTVREIEVLRLLARGRSSREIADALVISARTVERHIANIYAKLNVRTRAQATAYALTRGLARFDSA